MRAQWDNSVLFDEDVSNCEMDSISFFCQIDVIYSLKKASIFCKEINVIVADFLHTPYRTTETHIVEVCSIKPDNMA